MNQTLNGHKPGDNGVRHQKVSSLSLSALRILKIMVKQRGIRPTADKLHIGWVTCTRLYNGGAATPPVIDRVEPLILGIGMLGWEGV
jgi:hypothetical protein